MITLSQQAVNTGATWWSGFQIFTAHGSNCPAAGSATWSWAESSL